MMVVAAKAVQIAIILIMVLYCVLVILMMSIGPKRSLSPLLLPYLPIMSHGWPSSLTLKSPLPQW